MPMWDPNMKEDAEKGGGGWAPKPGEYEFNIDDVEEGYVSSNGNECTVVKLLVDAGGKFDVKCFDYIAVGKAAWKVKQLAEAVGLSTSKELEARDFIGRNGRGLFKLDAKNPKAEYRNKLKIDQYLPLSQSAADSSAVPPAPALGEGDNTPF